MNIYTTIIEKKKFMDAKLQVVPFGCRMRLEMKRQKTIKISSEKYLEINK